MHRHDVSVVMVDISEKENVERIAVASGSIKLKNSTIEKIRRRDIKKGDVLACAETAAILAVKKTPDMIPLCHPISIEAVKVDFSMCEEDIKATVSVKSVGKTGVEMDALHGLSVALLTIWDMVKSEEKDETGNYPHTWIEGIRVERKEKRGLLS
ncbi:MAG: cyclic pyranopterin monophosphate synthase MoaC [Methanophagales archaeon]|nr:cyclic pyranopterin monophosphate synthase MoaC [Methanophagales archaeon]RLG35044.1 MAG: cyclic pyranopterin monophosphate synthase MoaC [Methanosarcinales archaeon]